LIIQSISIILEYLEEYSVKYSIKSALASFSSSVFASLFSKLVHENNDNKYCVSSIEGIGELKT
jgi:hypothetical protein